VLQGDRIRLRQVRDADLDRLYDFHEDIANRGAFYPVGVYGWPTFREKYQKTGFLEPKEGMLIIAGDDDVILGHIEFFETVSYLDEIEIGYILYSQEQAGRGIATEAVKLLSDYLFGRTKVNRIRLVIHPGNMASRRVAEKAGFTREGVARGAWYHRGSNHDVEIWALLRAEHNQDN
jgi:ribosomal-protein-alanine N-acetyltransferase